MTTTTRSTLDPDTFTFPRYREDPFAEPQWLRRPPSRLLRKLYAELTRLEARLATARSRRYVLEHAPSDFRARRQACRPLEARVRALQARLDAAQNR